MRLSHIYYAKTACSIAAAIFQAISAPAGIDGGSLTDMPVIQPISQSYNQESSRISAMERKRIMYEANTNTIFLSQNTITARQEIAMGPHI